MFYCTVSANRWKGSSYRRSVHQALWQTLVRPGQYVSVEWNYIMSYIMQIIWCVKYVLALLVKNQNFDAGLDSVQYLDQRTLQKILLRLKSYISDGKRHFRILVEYVICVIEQNTVI